MIRSCCGTIFILTVALFLNVPGVAVAAESYDNCTGFITSLPAVISAPGTWCLKQDLSTAMSSGNAIELQASDVTIDCNNFKLSGLAAGITTGATGIFSSAYTYEAVRHCDIRGFSTGIRLSGSRLGGGHHTVEDNRLNGNTWIGMSVDGDSSVVQRNQVLNTGGLKDTSHAFGIVTSYTVDVLDNTVAGVKAATGGNGNAYGIYLPGSSDGRVVGNRVRGLKKGTGPVPGTTFGINLAAGFRVSIRDNDLKGDSSPGSVGLFCIVNKSSARDNVISGFGSAIANCADGGGNVSGP